VRRSSCGNFQPPPSRIPGKPVYIYRATINLELNVVFIFKISPLLSPAATQDRSIASVPFPALLSPFVESARVRRMVSSPRQPVLIQAAFFARLNDALADYSLDSRPAPGRVLARRGGVSSDYGLRSAVGGSRLAAFESRL
jgi:hypothetical protein